MILSLSYSLASSANSAQTNDIAATKPNYMPAEKENDTQASYGGVTAVTDSAPSNHVRLELDSNNDIRVRHL